MTIDAKASDWGFPRKYDPNKDPTDQVLLLAKREADEDAERRPDLYGPRKDHTSK